MIWAIGDIHGNISTYESILKTIHQYDLDAYTFQVGDMGMGFRGVAYPKVGPNDFWIAGNHDDALICKKCPCNLGDYGVKQVMGMKVFFIRGAMTTDKYRRHDGISFWQYEELTYQDCLKAIDLYIQEKPDMVVSHDCPMQVRSLHKMAQRPHGVTVPVLTQMYEAHQPNYWCYGHHHMNWKDKVGDTAFTCIAPLERVIIAGEEQPT